MQLESSSADHFKFTQDNRSTLSLALKFMDCCHYAVVGLRVSETKVFHRSFISGMYNLVARRCVELDMQHKYVAQMFRALLCDWSTPVALIAVVSTIVRKDVVYNHLFYVPDAIHSILLITRSYGDANRRLVPSKEFTNNTKKFNQSKKGFRLFVVTSLYRRYLKCELGDNNELFDDYEVYFEEFDLDLF